MLSCYYLNLFVILAKGTVRYTYDRTQAPNATANGGDASRVGFFSSLVPRWELR